MNNQKLGVLFLIPPAFERLDDVMECFEAQGFATYLARYGSAAKEKSRSKTMLEGLKELTDLACVVHPDDLDFHDIWAGDRIQERSGNIADALHALKARGLVLVPFKMDWGGFDENTVVIYGPPMDVVHAVQLALNKP